MSKECITVGYGVKVCFDIEDNWLQLIDTESQQVGMVETYLNELDKLIEVLQKVQFKLQEKKNIKSYFFFCPGCNCRLGEDRYKCFGCGLELEREKE